MSATRICILTAAAALAGCTSGTGAHRSVSSSRLRPPASRLGVRSSPDWSPEETASADPQWYRVDAGTKGHLLGVHFPDAKNGWTVGADGLVLRTADGGRTWKQQKTGLSKSDLYAVHFLDARRGWACGGNGDGPRARGHILMGGDMSAAAVLRTTDGGGSWEKVWAPTNFTLTAIRMLDDKRGVIGSHGGARHPDGDTVTSFDGGSSWGTKRIFRALHALCFVDGKTGFAAGTRVMVGFFPQPRDPLYLRKTTRLARTTDGGRTWRPMKHPEIGPRGQLTGISFADAKSGWACGSGGILLHTADGGEAWTKQESGTEAPIRDVFALSAKECWAVGYKGTILHTADGGASWKKVPCDPKTTLRRVWFTSPDHGVAVGFGGTILLYTREGSGLTPAADAGPKPADP
ncbi:MAG: WD40/YVTN/BNR-like repeat-containing protein [Planctomycetota bacterium]|jgi:photosystem II stability/assembly factor-like uncharacterized protein